MICFMGIYLHLKNMTSWNSVSGKTSLHLHYRKLSRNCSIFSTLFMVINHLRYIGPRSSGFNENNLIMSRLIIPFFILHIPFFHSAYLLRVKWGFLSPKMGPQKLESDLINRSLGALILGGCELDHGVGWRVNISNLPCAACIATLEDTRINCFGFFSRYIAL